MGLGTCKASPSRNALNAAAKPTRTTKGSVTRARFQKANRNGSHRSVRPLKEEKKRKLWQDPPKE